MFSYELNKNENLIRIVRRHPLTFLLPVFKAALLFLIIGVGGYWVLKIYKDVFKELAALAGFLLGSLYLFLKWLSWSATVLIITNERVIDINRKGIFRKTVIEVELGDVQEVLYEINGVVATLFKIGSVFIKTREGTIAMKGTRRPEEIYKIIIEAKKSYSR